MGGDYGSGKGGVNTCAGLLLTHEPQAADVVHLRVISERFDGVFACDLGIRGDDFEPGQAAGLVACDFHGAHAFHLGKRAFDLVGAMNAHDAGDLAVIDELDRIACDAGGDGDETEEECEKVFHGAGVIDRGGREAAARHG